MSLTKPRIMKCTVGNKSLSFVSRIGNRVIFSLASEHKKSKLFRMELIFSCPIVG